MPQHMNQPRRSRHPRTTRRRITGAITAASMLAAAGCDGGGNSEPSSTSAPTSSTAASPEHAAFAFAQCMRDHGITGYPDPTLEADGGIMFEGLNDLDASSEQLEATQQECDTLSASEPPEREPQEIDRAPAGWEQIVPGGDCECAGGSEYSFYARSANPDKVVLFLDGGGACWSEETCAPDGGNPYQATVDPPNGEGVFDFANERNPFADHSFVFAPYCTGDLFIGDADTDYASGLTVQHRGYDNGTAALEHLATTFPDATEVVVIGASAGSATAAVYGGLVGDRLPEAEVTVFADSSGAYTSLPALNNILTGTAWNAASVLPEWAQHSDPTTDVTSIPGFVVGAARHNPTIVFARYDHAYDENQATHLTLAGAPADDLVTLIDQAAAAIEDAGVDLHHYVASGDDHVVFDNDDFYDERVDDVALTDWVTDILHGEAVKDVHCTDCLRS